MRTHILSLAGFLLATAAAGCMYPSTYYGYPYQQPGYAPPGQLSQPGSLYIPPSNAPPYDPLNNPSTYDEPTDDWKGPGSGDTRFFGEEGTSSGGGVPNPIDAGSGTRSPFDQDLPGT